MDPRTEQFLLADFTVTEIFPVIFHEENHLENFVLAGIFAIFFSEILRSIGIWHRKFSVKWFSFWKFQITAFGFSGNLQQEILMPFTAATKSPEMSVVWKAHTTETAARMIAI